MRALPVFAAAVLLVGAAHAAPAPTVRTVPGTPLRIGLPAGWRILDHKTALAAVKNVGSLNPQMAPIVSLLAKNGSLLRLVAFDPHTTNGFATNANVVAQPAPAASLAKTVALELPAMRQAIHPIGLRQTATHAAGKPAVAVTFDAAFNEPNGTTLVAEKQVYVISAGTLYVLTLTTLPDRRTFYAKTFARIIASLRFA